MAFWNRGDLRFNTENLAELREKKANIEALIEQAEKVRTEILSDLTPEEIRSEELYQRGKED